MEYKYCNNVPSAIAYEVFALCTKVENEGGFTAENVKKYPVTAAELSFEIVDQIVSLIRLNRTNECYDTHGSISEDDVLLDLTQKIDWTIKEKYHLLLLKLSQKLQCTENFALLVRLEKSLRLKRAKGSSWVYYTCTIPPQESMAFNLSYRDTVDEDIAGYIPIVFKMERFCALCQKFATSFCARCRDAHYCALQCQRQHWSIHKKSCKKSKFSSLKKTNDHSRS